MPIQPTQAPSAKGSGSAPAVQDYGNLAHDYDETRYVGEINTLKEGYRRRALKDLLPARADRAVDVACGTGRGVLILRDVAPVVFGVDGTLEMLRIAHGKIQPFGRVAV